jgi:hypothetical protein
MKLKKVFECYDVDRGLIVGTKRLYAGWHDDVNPRLKHGFQIPYCNSFIDSGEKKAKSPRTLGHDLAPAFSERSLDRENNRVRRIPAEVLDRRKDEIRLAVDDRLR